tara:strand:+ start:16901 stop:17878 length:978 start_codon:yes stop_codon:yes gene_type:complete
MNSNVIKVSVALLSLYVIGSIYNNYKLNENKSNLENNNLLINDYLLHEITSHKIKKPILWIHIPYKKNSRQWNDFYSRTNENINQPYIYLCIKSIIDRCGDSFHVCIIDDDSFEKLLPTWNIDMTKISEPIIDYMRTLAFMKLLYTYGGMFVPYSFVCYKNLITFYKNNENLPFCIDTITDNSVSNSTQLFPSYKFIGATKENETIKELIKNIEIVIHNNCTNEVNFKGTLDKLLYEKISENRMTLINGKLIGEKTSNNEIVSIETLFSEKPITFDKTILGVYLPSKEIIERVKYNWFSRLSVDECINGDLNISLILKKSINQYL